MFSFFYVQIAGGRDTLWGSPYCQDSTPFKKLYEYSQQTVPDIPQGNSGPNEHRCSLEDYRRNTVRDRRVGPEGDPVSSYGDKTSTLQGCYRNPAGAEDLEVVETLLSFSKLEAARWNSQRCDTAALELPPSPPSSQGGVSPHHPLESDVEETYDTMHLRRRTSKDLEFGKVYIHSAYDRCWVSYTYNT